MIFIKIDENQNVNYRYRDHKEYMQIYGKTLEELLSEGYLVDEIPEPEIIKGKYAVLKFDDNQLYYEYYDVPLSIEEQLAQKDLQIKSLELQQKQLNDDLLAFMDYVTMGGM